MIPIYGKTNEEAWLKAIKHFIDNDKSVEYNLILEVDQPDRTDTRSKMIRSELDALLKDANKYSINTVAETIFPAAEYKRHGADGVLNIYPDIIYPQIKSKPGNSRGTYALRIVRGKKSNGEQCNPLENVIKKFEKQLNRETGTVKCIYELSLDEVETIAINRNDTSGIGFPCLSHISFKLDKENCKVLLTALYRSQFYAQKALGNLRGLARLQSFVARELGLAVGPLVCHATYATLDTCTNLGRSKLEALVKKH